MRMTVSVLASFALAAVAGCGSPLTCTTAPCGSGSAKTVQECVNTNGSVTYNFGGMSCSCSSAGCQTCAAQIASYCGGGTGGSGGTGGGGSGGTGGSGGSGGGSCSITLAGAVTGTFSCTSVITYASSSNLGGVTLSPSNPAPLQGLTVTVQRSGMPTSGAWSDGDAGAKAGIVVQQPGMIPPTWEASKGGSMDQGSYTMSLTVGTGTSTGNGMVYTGSGSLTATLPAITQTGASGSVTLTATF